MKSFQEVSADSNAAGIRFVMTELEMIHFSLSVAENPSATESDKATSWNEASSTLNFVMRTLPHLILASDEDTLIHAKLDRIGKRRVALFRAGWLP